MRSRCGWRPDGNGKRPSLPGCNRRAWTPSSCRCSPTATRTARLRCSIAAKPGASRPTSRWCGSGAWCWWKSNPSGSSSAIVRATCIQGSDRRYWEDYLAFHRDGLAICIFFVHIPTLEVRAASLAELDAHPGKRVRERTFHPTAGGMGMVYWPHTVGRLVARIITDDVDQPRLRRATGMHLPFRDPGAAPSQTASDEAASAPPVQPNSQSRSV